MKSLSKYIVEELEQKYIDILQDVIRNAKIIDNTDNDTYSEITDAIQDLQDATRDYTTITKYLVKKQLNYPFLRKVIYDNSTKNKEVLSAIIQSEIQSTEFRKNINLFDFLKDRLKQTDFNDNDIQIFINNIFEIKQSNVGKSVGNGEYLLRLIFSDSIPSKTDKFDIWTSNGNYEVKSVVGKYETNLFGKSTEKYIKKLVPGLSDKLINTALEQNKFNEEVEIFLRILSGYANQYFNKEVICEYIFKTPNEIIVLPKDIAFKNYTDFDIKDIAESGNISKLPPINDDLIQFLNENNIVLDRFDRLGFTIKK